MRISKKVFLIALLTISFLLFNPSSSYADVGLMVGNTNLNLVDTQNIIFGSIGPESTNTTSFILMQKGGNDIFKADINGHITTKGIISSAIGFRINNTAGNAGDYLRSNGSNFITSRIQATDIPVLNQNTSGYAGNLLYEDRRQITPSNLGVNLLKFGFTSYNNNSSAPWADFIHMRSYGDSSGGDNNLLVFNKTGIGARIYQQTFGSASTYSSFKDILLSDNSPAVNYLIKYTVAGNQVSAGKSIVYDDGSIVAIGSTATSSKLNIYAGTGHAINTGGGRIKGLPNTIIDNDEAVSKKYLHDNFTSSSTTLSIKGSLWATSTAGTYNIGLGSVGIGTTNPYQKLDVSGKIALNGTTVAYLPTAFSGTLVLGNGGNSFSNTTGTEGYYNTFVGIGAGNANTTGQSNTANGYLSLYANTTGSYNTANGHQSLYANTTGSYNTANGLQSLYANTTGSNNTANGRNSLYVNTTGSYNTANGLQSLGANTTGSYNTASGHSSLYSNTTGNYNTANGYDAGRYTNAGVANETSSNSLYLGYNTKALASGDTNEIVIGYGALGAGSNSVVLGNDSITKTILKGSVGIGTATLSEKLTVAGNVEATGFFHSSDARLKKNVKTLAGALGKIRQLNPVQFTWIESGDLSQGFIAQELEKVIPELVNTNSISGMKSVQYANLTALLTAGVQEQEHKIEQLQTEIEILKLRLDKLDSLDK